VQHISRRLEGEHDLDDLEFLTQLRQIHTEEDNPQVETLEVKVSTELCDLEEGNGGEI
jgi:hypothetical protein